MLLSFFFFFNDTATTEIYTLSLHDALPIFPGPIHVFAVQLVLVAKVLGRVSQASIVKQRFVVIDHAGVNRERDTIRSEEHTSELQSRQYLVCRLLLEKKQHTHTSHHAVTAP